MCLEMLTARLLGVAPLAHLAIYKVCNVSCSENAVLAAIDVAIEDGVDILSLSLSRNPNTLYDDFVSIGAYWAVQHGIFVSCAGGNDGPTNSEYITNGAPWVLTVGESTIDRKIKAVAVLGNKQQLQGESAYQPKDFPSTKQYPLFYPGLNQSDTEANRYCEALGNVTGAVRGRIVVCEVGGSTGVIQKGQNVKDAGGFGMILINQEQMGYSTFADVHVLPATHLSYADGIKLISYMNSTTSPTSAISYKGTVVGDPLAPQVASFSSRGPNIVSSGILKPDILGPGSNILAAWHQPIGNDDKNTKSYFNMKSGTSMACLHLSSVAALLKSSHPDWSPAAIKSAIMTTADLVNHAKTPIQDEHQLRADIFSVGSGHVNPIKANDPGLICDIEPKDYIPYLCGLNYTDRKIGILLQRNVHCTKSIPEAQLNYPAFVLHFGERGGVQNCTRTVTTFERVDHSPELPRSQGSITWSSQKYSVRIPVAVILT